ncbi:ParB/RepB/Spo0J family partition protein [Salisaeta longa]|uniref:ParB/RepB/Spo0J family partition protein n=1 Tax=Salisaeta longa TaxID=503170 RepID=UPI0003B7878D|nr:ParB/RepB/Spo0J family partition protein [Salisaeta longa]
MANKRALGKGLSALLPSDEQDDGSSGADAPARAEGSRLLGRVAEVAVEAIRPNPYQPRQSFSDEALGELAASIEQLGIIQPITVRALGGGQFEIISGERRWRAARRAGLEHVPAFVRKADSEQMLEMALVENVQREELNPIEVAMGYQRLIDECSLTQEEVSEKVGKSRSTVANFLRLLKLPPRIQAALRDGDIAQGHARALIAIDDTEVQLTFLQRTIAEEWSVRTVEREVRAWHEAQSADASDDDDDDAPPAPDPAPSRNDLQLEDLRSKLRSRFSTQVRIQHKSNDEGRIELAYYSQEDLERLMELLLDA